MSANGIDSVSRPLPGGGGSARTVGEGFRPNLAMGGGSQRIPLDLPHGPGGVTPRVELLYSTGLGTGVFGMGWTLNTPFVERRRSSPFRPAEPDSFTLSGSEPLVALPGERWAPAVGTQPQIFTREADGWTCRTPDLLTMTFGTTAQSRLAGQVDGSEQVVRWFVDTITFPNGVEVRHEYETVDGENRLARITYSAYELLLEYEARPDPSVSRALGFAVPLLSRCTRLLLRHSIGGAPTDGRAWELTYTEAGAAGHSLLASMTVVGWHAENDTLVESRRSPLTFSYTAFDPGRERIRRFSAAVVPPSPIDGDVTLIDYLGTSLPGVLRLGRDGATYWENRGEANFGPPQRLRRLPGGISLNEDPVRFADLTGNGTADLLVGDPIGGTWFEHDPANGFAARRQLRLAAGFGLEDERSTFLDLDGDGLVDLLAFRDGTPFGFINNDHGLEWTGPFVLPWGDLPPRLDRDPRLRFADMTGDGLPDVVLLRSQAVTYWPNLGGGRLGAPITVEGTPAFEVPDPDRNVYLADVDGDGAADLIMIGAGEVRIHLNQGGQRFGPAILIGRTPPLASSQAMLADMTGSGTTGLLWTMSPGTDGTTGYLYLDLLGGVKPYLLSSMDNGAGLHTDITYTTSSRERTRDLAAGHRWTGYLPFPVHVVASITTTDSVTGQSASTSYRYHDGQFDGRTRQWLGFAEVEAEESETDHESASMQRLWFHNQLASAGVPAFDAGRGQPHRLEVADPATGEVRMVSTSTWSALPTDPDHVESGSWLAVETGRTSTRLDGGVPYSTERYLYEHDDIGNTVRETRRGEWSDADGPHVDELRIDRVFATHQVRGPTSYRSRERKSSAGRLLKGVDWFYDGPEFVGLPFGEVQRGYISRQSEIALTPRMRADAYGSAPPPVLDDLHRTEIDPELGTVHISDTRRYQHDAFGNQIATLDALNMQVEINYDADRLNPTSITESDRAARSVTFDPVVQQATAVEDSNGNMLRTRFNGLGEIVAVWKRGSEDDKPTETYSYDRHTVPHRKVQHVRVLPSDTVPGWERHSHLDGTGRAFQVRTRTRTGWAVEQTKVMSVRNREIAVIDCYEATTPDFETAAPAGTVRHDKYYDFAGRLERESLFGGAEIRHQYVGAETRFYDPEATKAFVLDPTSPPSRTSRADAWDRIVAIVEHDGTATPTEHRRYDALGELIEIIDAGRVTALVSVIDGQGNRIRVDSADSGTTTFVYDADNHEVLRVDADGRQLYHERDSRGRGVRVIGGGTTGTVEDTYTYDTGPGGNLVGRLARVVGSFGTADYSYDVEGNPISITRTFTGDPTAYTVAYTYDSQSQVRSVTYPDGHVVTYAYDPDGLLRAISGVVDDIEYGPHGRRTRMLFANGLECRRHVTEGDHLLREMSVEVVSELQGGPALGTKLQHLVYTLDEVGRVLAADDLSTVTGKIRNTQTFGYDPRNRLAFATGTGSGGAAYRFDYSYDPAGNLVDGETFTGMIHGRDGTDVAHPNCLVRRGGTPATEYTYDASGNLIADPDLGALEYDVRHRLVRITRPDGGVVEYDYDHNDRRVTTRVARGGETRTRHEVEGIYIVDTGGSTKVVFDEDRRLALIPSAGNALLQHPDRLGNINVVSNLNTGGFVAGNEHSPWGILATSIVLQPHYTFQGAMLTDGLDIVLLGQRWYRPGLGRFLTADSYLLVQQNNIPGLHGGAHLYLYALDNPANFTDPTGRIAFLAALGIAAIVGAIIGAIGAATNEVKTWDEFLLWTLGGAIGGMFAVAAGVLVGLGAVASLLMFATFGLLGALVTPALDASESRDAWFISFLIKWAQSPITTTFGLISAAIIGAGGGNVDFRRGMLFVQSTPAGGSGGVLTLGAVAFTPASKFDKYGNVSDALARHEAHHSRTIAAIGELGFYLTYVTVGLTWGIAEAGSLDYWNYADNEKGGNPFEKTGHVYEFGGKARSS